MGRRRAGASGSPRPSSSSPTLGYGGTLDLLAYDEAGRTVLADVKSGANVYPEVVLQLLAYGEAALIAPQGSPLAYPMPTIERYVVLHVTDAGVRVIDVEVDDDDRAALAGLPAAVALARRAEGAAAVMAGWEAA